LNLRAGDILRIPTPATPVTTTVSGGATPKPGAGKEYKVQANDTCDAIAKSYGVSVADLIARNGLDANCQKLQIGQVLKIP
jgi:LysM repeat protein